MKTIAVGVAIALTILIGSAPANARPHDEGFGTQLGYEVSRQSDRASGRSRSGSRARTGRSESFASLSDGARYSAGPRPRKWCGWWMRTQLGGPPSLNVAWNWRHYGSPTTAQVGAVVVWRGHVGMITGQAANGQWIVKSGNDGGRVRERARSVAGAIFRI